MCGIVGFFDPFKNINEKDLKEMTDSLASRGPNRQKYLIREEGLFRIGLGHTRLGILDPRESCDQPFVSECQNYLLVYNGEIYNFLEIKEQLLKKHTFKTKGDTEVLFRAFIEWGPECINKLVGMFAFCFIDLKKQKGFFVRDRVGIKPLYYSFSSGIFFFGSELKSFVQNVYFKKELNQEVLPIYFRLGYVPSPKTIYKNTYKLNPGSFMTFDLTSGSHKTTTYWSPSMAFGKEKLTFNNKKNLLDDLESLLNNVVKEHQVSDKPIGLFLSGGFDSTLLATLLSNQKKINTFTIGFDDKEYNEALFAKKIAKKLKTNHQTFYLNQKDIEEILDYLPQVYDEPFGDTSSIPMMFISKKAKQYIDVALTGDGADELFGGYSKYQFVLNFFQKNFLSKQMFNFFIYTFPSPVIGFLNSYLPDKYRVHNFLVKLEKAKRGLGKKRLEEMFFEITAKSNPKDVFELFLNQKEYGNLKKSISFNDMFLKKEKQMSDLEWMTSVDFSSYLLDDILVKSDRSSMAYGLEGRVPFLDHRLVEFSNGLSSADRFDFKNPKGLLKNILYRYLPEKTMQRPKYGFEIPMGTLLKKDFYYLIEKYLNKKRLQETDLFNPNAVKKVCDSFLMGKCPSYHLIWYLIQFERWREIWL